MKTYARIQDGLVAELLKTDGDITSMFNPALVWVDVSSQPNIAEGWHFDGTNFTPPSAPPPASHRPDNCRAAGAACRYSARSSQRLSGKS